MPLENMFHRNDPNDFFFLKTKEKHLLNFTRNSTKINKVFKLTFGDFKFSSPWVLLSAIIILIHSYTMFNTISNDSMSKKKRKLEIQKFKWWWNILV